MKLPLAKRILKESVIGAPQWINSVIDPVNEFNQNVSTALTKNLNFQDNVNCFIKEFTYTTPYTTIFQFRNELKTKPIGILMLQIYDKQTYIPSDTVNNVPWVESNGDIKIYPITTLDNDKSFLIRLLIF